ncbi:hypothetical protein SAMN04490200_0996 [Pseudomonas proteolytica]|nr:hypothetical protein SAMN04490200_0996 [Pseudomonas proteolytica]
MMGNNSVSNSQSSAVNSDCLSEQEVILLALFRAISAQQQNDVIRLLEVFAQAPE